MTLDALADVRYAVRRLAQSPGFTIVTVVILGLGIGANTTIFTLVSALFFAPPPEIAEPDRLVRINRATTRSSSLSLSYPDYQYYRANSTTFSDILGYDSDGIALTTRVGDRHEQQRGLFVSANYFDVLGVVMAFGRGFRADEDRGPGEAPVAVVSHRYWRQSLGGDPGAIGRSIAINGRPFTVVGVAPERFRGPSPIEATPDLWMPITMFPVLSPTGSSYFIREPGQQVRWIWAIGRLADGEEVAAARANMEALATRLAEEFADWNTGQGVAVTEHFQFHPPLRRILLTLSRLLLGVVGLVLLIASANVAILLLARASSRRKEMGVRIALGAGRGRLVRQLLTESLLLGGIGGVAGYLIAFWSAGLAAALVPLSFAVEFTPDLRVLAFTVVISVSTALLFGVVPAMQSARTDVGVIVKESMPRRESAAVRNGLVVFQVALSIVLVTGAVIFGRSLINARSIDLGFDPDRRLVVAVDLGNYGYDEERGLAFTRQARERLESLPGVRAASTTGMVPFRGSWGGGYRAEGVPLADDEYLDAGFNRVGPEYFRAMGIPIVAGREFTAADGPGAPGVAVVNETVAQSVWPGESPIGRRITRGDLAMTIVGVARNATYYELGEDPEPQIYFPALQQYGPTVQFLVWTESTPMAMARAVQDELHALDPDLAFSFVGTLDGTFATEIGKYQVSAILVSLFGVLALVLAAVGLYGVLSYGVTQRAREIGIRVALGATRQRVQGEVLRGGLRLAGTGIVIGVVASAAVSRLITSLLYGIGPRDPVTFLSVPLLLTVVAVLASVFPARRATRVQPVDVLRQ